MAELTERQQDQKVVEDMRAENVRRAERSIAVDPGGCAPPVYVEGST